MTAEAKAAAVRPGGTRGNDTGSPRRGTPPRPQDVADAAERAAGTRSAGRSIAVRRSGLREPRLLLRALHADGGPWAPTLKLWLTYTWLARDGESVTMPTAFMAGLLGFAGDQSPIRGAADSALLLRGLRRCRDATGRLATVGLADVETTRGGPKVTLMREDGALTANGERRVRWRHPGKNLSAEPEVTGRPGAGYVQLPPTLFTNGWLVALSGRALWALLVLTAEQADGKAMIGRGKVEPVHLAPAQRKADYGMADATWLAAIGELAGQGVVRHKVVVARHPVTLVPEKVVRYHLEPAALNRQPPAVVAWRAKAATT
jgi:hypothetical protein